MAMRVRAAFAHASRLATDLADFVYPPACPVCQAPPGTSPLCASCEGSLCTLPGPACSRCRLFVPHGGACPLGHADLVVHALGLFDAHYRALLHALKFHGELRVGEWLGRRLGEVLATRNLADIGAVIPVPLHATRLRERGYNQSRVIAIEVALRLGVPLVEPLRRRRNTRSQTELSRQKRLENVADAFVAEKTLDSAPILLVDDVLTTGATLEACALALRAAGMGPVRAATVALAEP